MAAAARPRPPPSRKELSELGVSLSALQALSGPQRRALALAAALAAPAVAGRLRQLGRAARRRQRGIMAGVAEPGGLRAKKGGKRVGVDRAFFERLKTILGICVPSWRSKEAGLILVQGLLLVSRTVLSEKISEVEGRGATNIISQQFHKFAGTMLDFALLTAPAALVNSGLKWFQKLIELAFRDRLTRKLHELYLGGRCYYLASSLGGLSHADQRITEDVEKFSFAVSELYSYTFKPLLDVLLFSHSLTRTMGYKYQAVLYGYYALVAVALKATSPPISLLVAQESALTAGFRAAHHRIVNKAEEIAYNDPPGGATELLILNHHLSGQLQHAALTSYQRFLQRFGDQYLVKYGASLLGLFAYAAPVYFTVSGTRARTRQAPTLPVPFPPIHSRECAGD